MKTGYRLGSLMKRPVHTIQCKKSVREAAAVMDSNNIGCLIVFREGTAAGIITFSDVVRKMVARGIDGRDTLVETVMSSPLITMDPRTDVYDALLFLNKEGIRHLPILKRNRVVGIVTISDILRVNPGIIETVFHKGGIHARREEFLRT